MLRLIVVGIARLTELLGSQLVDRVRIGVDDTAGVDTPSSLGGATPERAPSRDGSRTARAG